MTIYLYLRCLGETPLNRTFKKDQRVEVLSHIQKIKDKQEQEEVLTLMDNPRSALYQFMQDTKNTYPFDFFSCCRGKNWYVKQVQSLRSTWNLDSERESLLEQSINNR